MDTQEYGFVDDRDWPAYGGNAAGNRYSALDQINLDNVHELEVVWSYSPTDSLKVLRSPERLSCQPIVIKDRLYGTGPRSELFALDATTGQELWRFEPPDHSINRGLNYWKDGGDERILYVAGSHLYAIDAMTGKPIKTFGGEGRVDFHLGLEDSRPNAQDLSITSTSPGVIFKDILVIGSTVSEYGDALPGDIRGFSVRTGELKWIFHTIPRPGELGYDTWPKNAYRKIGGANCWAGMVLDESRGIVYLGTGSPAVDFYGGDREGANLFANCILALDAITGDYQWHFQTIHHDLWDLDITCPPNLVTVRHQGKMVDAVVQTTKDGLIYVLDRDTGASLFPLEVRSVPDSDLPGERPFPTQKFPLKPAPFVSRQVLTEDDLRDSIYLPGGLQTIKERFRSTRHGQKFIPPSKRGIWYIGTAGGAMWGGNAVDPKGILYQNSSELPTDLVMVGIEEKLKDGHSRASRLYLQHCAACHGADRKGDGVEIASLVDVKERLTKAEIQQLFKSGRGRMPSFQHLRESHQQAIIRFIYDEIQVLEDEDDIHGASSGLNEGPSEFPYVPPFIQTGYNKVTGSDGYPGVKPPWGTLNAIDLNTGEYLWRVPLGEYKALTQKGIPITGTPNRGGPVITEGGLLFIGATRDNKFRAFDRSTGATLWEYQLPAGGFATPITYALAGRQYIVIACGSGRNNEKVQSLRATYVAFALPEE